MRRLSWGCTSTISLALTITFCVGLASPAKQSLSWTDTYNENGFRDERQLGSTEGA